MDYLEEIMNSPSRVIFFCLDKEYRYLVFNRNHSETMRAIWGIDIEKGHSMLDYISNENDKIKAKANFDRALSGEEFTLIEEYGDEELLRSYYEDYYSPLRNEASEIIGLIVYVTDISERRKAEIRTQESQQLLESITSNIQEGIYRSTIDKGPIYVNDWFLKIYGYKSLEEIQKTTPHDFFVDPKARDSLVQKLRVELKITNERVHYKKKNGQTFWALLSASLEKGADGTEYMDGAVRDISIQKVAEDRLKASQRLLESINQNISEGIYRSDKNGLIYVNQAFANLFGYETPTEVLKSDAPVLYKDPKQRELLIELLEKEGHFENQEVIFLRKDKTEFICLTSSTSYTDENGTLFWDGAIRDITNERKTLEEIRRNEQLIKSISQNINEGIYRSTDTEGLIYVSDGFVKMFGYQTPQEVASLDPDELYRHPEDREKLRKRLEEDGRCENLEVEFRRKDGTFFYGSLTSTSFVDETDQVIFDGAIRDISERRKLLETATHQNDRLKEFSYITSHNIRSLASNLQGLVHIQEADPSNPDINGMLKITADKLNDTIANINELLNFEHEFESMRTRPCNLTDTIQRAVEMNDLIINEKKAEINSLLPEELMVPGFQAYLDSIFHNLISNAVKYGVTEKQHSVKICHELIEDAHCVSVQDWGIGIDLTRHANKLFNLGSRFHSDHSDGQGLGLFMTKRQVEAMGGRIEVESEPNQGTTFKVWLNA